MFFNDDMFRAADIPRAALVLGSELGTDRVGAYRQSARRRVLPVSLRKQQLQGRTSENSPISRTANGVMMFGWTAALVFWFLQHLVKRSRTGYRGSE